MKQLIIVFLGIILSLSSIAQTSWSLTGNSGTTSNFLGTTDNLPLRFRTNNAETMVLDENGNLTAYKGIKSKFLHLTEQGTYASIRNLSPSNGLELYSTNNLMFLSNAGNRRMFFKGDGDLLFAGGSGEELAGIGTGNGSNQLLFKTNGSTGVSPQEKMRLTPWGMLGIGTSSPIDYVHVYGTNAGVLIEGDNNSYFSGIRIKTVAGNGWINNYGFDGIWGMTMNVPTANGAVGLFTNPTFGNGSHSNDPGVVTHRVMGAYNQTANIFQVEVNGSPVPGNYYPYPLMTIASNGSMSLGLGAENATASAKLDIASTTQGFLAPRMTTVQKNAIATPAAGLMVYDNTLNSYNYFNGSTWQGMGGTAQWTMSGSDLSYITGSVGIGTSTPVVGYKLAVTGGIISEKVKVKLQSAGWADYVFEKEYRLPTLIEVEKFINDHKHLPGIPTAKEVGEKGLDLGENQAALLAKIEELTLYIIDQNKRIEKLEKKLEQIENK